MHRTSRHFGKNDNAKNFFGEEDYVEINNGHVSLRDVELHETSPPVKESKIEDEGSS